MMKNLITIATISDLKNSGIETSLLMESLPVSSVERLGKISSGDNFLRSLLGELLSRYALLLSTGEPAWKTEYTLSEKGKPLLQPGSSVHFNISHSADLVVCVVSNIEVGIDVEKVRRVNFRVAERFFSEEEKRDLFTKPEEERLDYFFLLWTIKESFLKAIGTGMTRTLSSFTVRTEGGRQILTGDSPAEDYLVYSCIPSQGYRLSVSSKLHRPSWEILRVQGKDIMNSLGLF